MEIIKRINHSFFIGTLFIIIGLLLFIPKIDYHDYAASFIFVGLILFLLGKFKNFKYNYSKTNNAGINIFSLVVKLVIMFVAVIAIHFNDFL